MTPESGAGRCRLLDAFSQALFGFVRASRRYGGGSLEGRPSVHHSLVVQSMSVHRIQEAQAALISALCERAAGALGVEEPAVEEPAVEGTG